MNSNHTIRALGADDAALLREMLGLFGEAFEDPDTYCSSQPTDEYLKSLLASTTFVAIAAFAEMQMVGALTGYILPKFEQQRSEFYIYDLGKR